jgi:hypothetical protein
MPFSQQFNGPVNNVYNVEGSLILGPNSGVDDFKQQLVNVGKQIDHDSALDSSVRKKVASELSAAHAEASSKKPDGSTVKSHLDKAAAVVESASKLTVKTGALAKTLVALGTWAIGALS